MCIRRLLVHWCSFVVVSFVLPCSWGRTIVVDAGGVGEFTSIQAAIEAAVDGDEIEVGPGTYSGTVNLRGKAVRVYSSGGAEATVIQGISNEGDFGRVVECISGEGSGTVLEGFTIQAEEEFGIGLYCEGSGPTVIDCVFVGFQFSDCEEDYGIGWGIKNYQSNPTVVRCTFRENGDWWGGGMRNVGSSAVVTDCVFENNGWGEIACGIHNLDSSVEISGCRFEDNRPQSIINWGGSAVITNCTFFAEGSMECSGADVQISWCVFVDVEIYNGHNTSATVKNSTFEGFGIVNSYSQAEVINCVFRLCDYGAMRNYSSSTVVTNCTFVENRPDMWYGGGGAILNNNHSNTVVRNCILWDNGASALHDRDGSTTAVTYSNVPGGRPGEGNIDEYPLFVNADAGDLRLRWFSPCVDAGSDAAAVGEQDCDGNPRVVDGNGDGVARVDMGAYEYQRESASLGTLLQIEIVPQEAADGGAGWRLAGETDWRVSGETVGGLAPGYYEVEFRDLDAWFEPAGMRVCVMRDLPASRTVEYRPVGVYAIGQIPPGEVRHGGTLAFYVYSAGLGEGAALGASVQPAPAGTLTFDGETGLFVYRPDGADVLPFEVTFSATLGDGLEEQVVTVGPIANLPAEYAIVSAPMQDMPEGESRDYLFVNEVVSEGDEMLNGTAKKVRSITVAGKTVVFAPGHASGLYESYSSVEGGPYVADIKEMTIYAETLIVGGPLLLPQTDLTVYARRLVLEGADTYISTKPYDGRTVGPSEVLAGLDGGDVHLDIASFGCQPAGGWRFRVGGTSGHNGGAMGSPGEMTWTLDEVRPLAWLSPYAVKMVAAHARDAYLYGYTVEAGEILGEYRELLETYMGLETWDSVEGTWQLELEQMYGEVVTLLHRIENGLDYFGNPPGWVPMLSFEITKAFYEQEINRAVRVMYLSYWVQNKAATIAEKSAALRRSREAVWGQTQDFANQYTQVQALIPKLKSDAARIAAQIGRADSGGCSGLLCQLKQKEEELIARADKIVQKRHEVPWWKKMLKGLSGIVTSTISGAASGGKAGAAAGFATGTITALTDTFLEEKDPWPAINNRTGVAKTFYEIDFEAASGEWLDNFDAIPNDLNAVEQSGAAGYLQGLRAQAASMAGGMHQIKEALKETSLSNEEVAVELKKLKAADARFNSLVDQVTQLSVEKEVFNRQLTAAMQKVSTLSNAITNNLLAIDGMNRNASHLNRVVDPRATMYVKDMEQRATERLRKYHYYLAKSYEYRLLKPSPMDLNIGNMFAAMQSIVSVDGTLDDSAFDALKTVYEEQLWALTDQIYRDYQENKSYEATAPVRLELTAAQIASLNAGSKVVINLKDAARFQYNEENTRIVDVEVETLEFHVEGTYDWRDYFDLEIEHSGVSRLQKDGEIYQFVHYKDVAQETNPINWNERHFADGYWQPVDRSEASESMLFSLLSNCQNAGTGDIMLYARPGAWADIVIKKAPHEENSGELVIDSVRLLVRYDRIIRPSQFSTLQIATQPQGLVPYFAVGRVDRWGRRDGVGELYRTYNTGLSTTVAAPVQSGDYSFVKWTDGAGNEVSQSAALSVFLDSNRKRIAQYVYTGPVASTADFNEDFIVDMGDFVGLSRAWFSQPGDWNWDPDYDISDPPDGVIDTHDLVKLAEEWLLMP